MATNPCRCPRPHSSDGLINMHGWGLSLYLDWSCQLLAWALVHPCRRPSWLSVCTLHPPLPSCLRLLYSTWLDSSCRTRLQWRECQCHNVSLTSMQQCCLCSAELYKWGSKEGGKSAKAFSSAHLTPKIWQMVVFNFNFLSLSLCMVAFFIYFLNRYLYTDIV